MDDAPAVHPDARVARSSRRAAIALRDFEWAVHAPADVGETVLGAMEVFLLAVWLDCGGARLLPAPDQAAVAMINARLL